MIIFFLIFGLFFFNLFGKEFFEVLKIFIDLFFNF
jgi:hypothetical protein